jgi:hypothetical protein
MIALMWLPFVLADTGTLNATQFTIVNEPSSALRALGVTSAGTPAWDRPAQMVIGCVLGAIAVWRRRWPAVLLLGVGARIALDPGVYDYYTAGVMLGTLCWETLGLRRPVPAWSLTAFAVLYLAPRMTGNAALLGELRLVLVLALTAAVLVMPQRWCTDVLSFTTGDGLATAEGRGPTFARLADVHGPTDPRRREAASDQDAAPEDRALT